MQQLVPSFLMFIFGLAQITRERVKSFRHFHVCMICRLNLFPRIYGCLLGLPFCNQSLLRDHWRERRGGKIFIHCFAFGKEFNSILVRGKPGTGTWPSFRKWMHCEDDRFTRPHREVHEKKPWTQRGKSSEFKGGSRNWRQTWKKGKKSEKTTVSGSLKTRPRPFSGFETRNFSFSRVLLIVVALFPPSSFMLTRHLCFYRVPNTHFYEGALFGSPLCTRANWHSQWQCSREVKHLQCRQHLDMSISGRMLVNFEKNCNYISISQPLTIWRIQNASPAKMIFQRKWDKFRNKLNSLFSIRSGQTT